MMNGISWKVSIRYMSKTFEKLNETFGIEEVQIVPEKQLPVVIEKSNDDVVDDYEITRATLHSLIEKGNDALDYMLDIAKGSEHPRTFEVTGQLIKTVAETAKDLIALQKTMKELKKGTVEENNNIIHQQNNIMFQGSTSDLLKAMRNNENVIEHGD